MNASVTHDAALSGKTAFITGAARGIGLATARAMAEAGASVILSDLETAPLEAAASGLRAEGREVRTALLDIGDPGACDRAAAEAEAAGPVDILVANAGIAWDDTPAESVTDEVWRRVVDVNLSGTFWSCRAFGRAMLERRAGAIVAVGSMSGLISNRPQRQVHYNAAKAGLHHMIRSLAGEWAPRGVRVNAVAPTYVNTPMSSVTAAEKPQMHKVWIENTPQGRMIEPAEVASVIAFLAGPGASAVTGAVVPVDAGYTIW